MQEQYQLDHSLDSYITKLISYGIKPNPKLQPAFFYLKNGLPYPGLLTTQEVNGHEDLVKIPIDLLLTSHRAMKEVELSSVFSNKFYREGTMWQDRILVTYLLFLLSKEKDCIWTEMVKQFSRDIDIVSFWQECEFDEFVDRSVLKAAKKQRSHFENQWKQFSQIQQQYDILKDGKWFNRDNYKWIYIHTISRCFGSFLKSTYFVPFCELFNHHSVDVSYTCINENQPPKELPQEQIEEDKRSESSVSSGYSEDYLSDDDFDYMSINSYSIKWCSKVSYDLKDKEVKAVDKSLKDIYFWIEKQLELKGFTLLYLGQIIEKLKVFQNQYKAGRQKFVSTQQKIENIKLSLFAYRKYLIELYRSQGREYQKIKNERGTPTSLRGNHTWSHFQKTKEQCQEVYTHFKMEARDHAFFKKNSQIYFSYGKLSNRTLLVRYGFSLQDNPYEHVWLKFKLGKYVEPYPDLFELIQRKGLAVNYKIKLKSYTFAVEPIVYFRMLNWKETHHCLQDIFFITDLQKQLDILAKVKEVYESEVQQYDKIDENLTDKEMGYHQYFARVYNLQKKKILSKQIQGILYLISVFDKILHKEIEMKTMEVKEEYKHFLKHYLKGLRGLRKT